MRISFIKHLSMLLLSLTMSILSPLAMMTVPVSAQGTWERMADLPGGGGGALVYPYPGDAYFMYALNQTGYLWKYDTWKDSWSPCEPPPFPVFTVAFKDLAYPGSDRYLYANGYGGLYRYDMWTDNWELINDWGGGELVADPSCEHPRGPCLYTAGGLGSWLCFRYVIADNDWVSAADRYGGWGLDIDMCYAVGPRFPDMTPTHYIYAITGTPHPGTGTGHEIAAYQLGGDGPSAWEWDDAGRTPVDTHPGVSLAWDGGNSLYMLRGGGSQLFYRRSLYPDAGPSVWERLADTPDIIRPGAALAFGRGSIYALQGWDGEFWRLLPETFREEFLWAAQAISGDFRGMFETPPFSNAWAGDRFNIDPADFQINIGESILFEGSLIDPGKVGRFVIVAVTPTEEILEYEVIISPRLLEGDVDLNEIVDIQDIVIAALAFGSTDAEPNVVGNPYDPHADLNIDGTIDIFDLVIIGINYGNTL